jgi:hypothetical protein
VRLTLPDQNVDLATVFSSAPDSIQGQFALGLKAISKLSDEQLRELMEILIESFASRAPLNETDVSVRFKISPEDAVGLITTSSIMAATLSTREDTVDQFVDALKKAQWISDPETSEAAARLGRITVANRDRMKEALSRSRLGAESLPVLTQFEATIDIRPNFDKESHRITFAVPIAILHIDTDAAAQEVRFQLTKRELEKMSNDVKDAVKRLEEAERWIKEATD